MTQINKAWLFDVDGVLTDPPKKKITKPEIVTEIIRLLENEPVGFITGRTVDWLEGRVISVFLEKCKDREILKNLFVSAEKGGVWGTLDLDGEIKIEVDRSLVLPEEAKEEIEKIAEKFSDIVFYDVPKKTMSSIELIDGLPTESLAKIHPQMDALIEEVLRKYGLEEDYRISSNVLATDIENKSSGKDLGTQRFVDWLKSEQINPGQFVAFGDNKEDLKMGEYLLKKGFRVTYVFVGDPKLIKKEDYSFEVILPKSLYDAGTLEYLKSH